MFVDDEGQEQNAHGHAYVARCTGCGAPITEWELNEYGQSCDVCADEMHECPACSRWISEAEHQDLGGCAGCADEGRVP